jgi:hypothetical protein
MGVVRKAVSIGPWRFAAAWATICTITAPAAMAQADGTRWGCHVADQHLVCRIEQAAIAPQAATPADPRLPPIVHTLRLQPASWRGRAVRIPLFNEPYDDSSLQPLAQAVLCGTVRGCRAEVGRDREPSMLALLDFADANDPLLQPAD